MGSIICLLCKGTALPFQKRMVPTHVRRRWIRTTRYRHVHPSRLTWTADIIATCVGSYLPGGPAIYSPRGMGILGKALLPFGNPALLLQGLTADIIVSSKNIKVNSESKTVAVQQHLRTQSPIALQSILISKTITYTCIPFKI